MYFVRVETRPTQLRVVGQLKQSSCHIMEKRLLHWPALGFRWCVRTPFLRFVKFSDTQGPEITIKPGSLLGIRPICANNPFCNCKIYRQIRFGEKNRTPCVNASRPLKAQSLFKTRCRKRAGSAARVNSSIAPLSPRNRNRSSFNIRYDVGKRHPDLLASVTRAGEYRFFMINSWLADWVSGLCWPLFVGTATSSRR